MKRDAAELEEKEKKEFRAVLAALLFIGLSGGNPRGSDKDIARLGQAIVLTNELLERI
jgi:hypothetical protein